MKRTPKAHRFLESLSPCLCSCSLRRRVAIECNRSLMSSELEGAWHDRVKKASRLLLACTVFSSDHSLVRGRRHRLCQNFNLETEDRVVYKADHGLGSIDASSASEWLRSYSGTDLGAHSADEAGLSLGVRGDSANGSGFELTFSARGTHTLQFAFRSSATGFHDCEIQRLTSDGWELVSAFGDASKSTAWTMVNVPLGDLSG